MSMRYMATWWYDPCGVMHARGESPEAAREAAMVKIRAERARLDAQPYPPWYKGCPILGITDEILIHDMEDGQYGA